MASIDITHANTPRHYELARELIAEYSAWDSAKTSELGLDAKTLLDFHYGGGAEDIPGKFAPPAGCLLLALDRGNAAGCGAYRALSDGICEMKRVYVRPGYRGQRLGQRIADALMDNARAAGYTSMRLETTTFMRDALKLYAGLGFKERAPYYTIPDIFLPVTVFMERPL